MSAIDLAKLALMLADNPGVHPKSAGQISDAFVARFQEADQSTVDAIANAPRDVTTSRALANAITHMTAPGLTALFMKVPSTRRSTHQTPLFASLATTDLTRVLDKALRDETWSAAESGKLFIAQLSSLVSQRLMAADSNTPQAELDALAKAAVSTALVANTKEFGQLFKLVHENAGKWCREETATFTAQVNARFLRECENIATAPPAEREWWSTVLGNVGLQWKFEVAIASEQAHVDLVEARTPLGAFSPDGLAELFLTLHRGLAGSLLGQADHFTDAVNRKFSACYAQVDIKTHQRLIQLFENMSSDGQEIFTAAANRPPRDLAPLVAQTLQPLGSAIVAMRGSNFDKEAALPAAFAHLVNHHISLPGHRATDEQLFDWMHDALRATGQTNSMLKVLNTVGPLHEALLAPQGELGRYLRAAARATEALDPNGWEEWSAQASVLRLFGGRAWTSALQRHFETLPAQTALETEKRTACLKFLKVYEKLKESSGLSESEAMKLTTKFERMRIGSFSRVRAVWADSSADKADRLSAFLDTWQSTARYATNELLTQGVNAYKSSSRSGKSGQAGRSPSKPE